MEKLLQKCLHVNSSENGLDQEESVFQTCKIFVGLENEISEVNGIDNKNIGNDFLCGFDNYAKKNCVEGIWMDELNRRKSGYMNLNEYCENKFNTYFNIEYIDYPIKFYKTIYFNFFSSFIENEDRKYILNENMDILNNFYENIRNQKYLLLHNAHSIPHEKKKINSNYKNGDAHMCSDNIISIADGVSSIKNSGINVSNFSNDLLKKCLNLHLYRCINKSLFEYQNDVIFKHYNLKYRNHEFLKPIICRSACSSNFLGASTLLFASVENDKLHICTIGDCQILIINLKEYYFKQKFFEKIHIKIQTSKQMLCLEKRESNVTTLVDEEKENCPSNIYNHILNSNQNNIIENNYDNYKQSSSSLNFDMSDKKMDKENVNSWNELIYDNSKSEISKWELNKSEFTKSDLAQSDLSKQLSVQSKKTISNTSSSHILLEDSPNNNTISVASEKTYGETNKSSISDLYLKRNKLCENVLYSDINVNRCVEESEETILYVEHEIDEDIYEKFQKCISECDYKIDDLSFKLKEENLYDCSNIRSDTIISHNFSDTTENDISESEKNEKKYISGMTNILDNETGYRNLLNFFQIDRNSILKRKKNKYNEIQSIKVNMSYDWMNDIDNKEYYSKESNKLQEDKTKLYNNNSINSSNNSSCSNNNNNNNNYYNSCKSEHTFNHYRYRHDNEGECPFDIIHKSKIQQHYFNCPYQITFMPSNFSNDNMKTKKSNSSFNSTINMNKYNDIITKCLRYCDYSTIDLKNNYIIISGSDGLFDNLYDDDIMKIIFNHFYILKDKKFIKLKEYVKFHEEYKKAISWIYKTISNNIDKNDTYKEDIYFSKQFNDVYNKNLLKKKDTKEINRNEFNRDDTKSDNSISDYEKKKSICIDTFEDQNVCNNDNNINCENLITCDEHYMNKNSNEIIKKKGSNLFLNKLYSKGSFNSTMNKFNFVPKIKKIFSFKEKDKSDKKDEDKLNPSFSYSSNITLNNTFEKQKEHGQLSNSICDQKDLKRMNMSNFESADTMKRDESIQFVRNYIPNMKYAKNYNHNNYMLNQQDTFDVIFKTYDIKNDFSIDMELNNIRYNKKKRTFIIEKKIEALNLLCNSSDLILFDENMNIYLNTKKACDEIIELSSILSNQQVNYSLLKKRQKKYNNDKENKKNNKKSFTTSLFSNIQEKEKYLFDNINYDDIQSNKSNDKIILTPISEFIFDKYKKYFNMGKPDDTTVIVSIVKENKYV
ncbi:conserved Plasmodium protein, unknown function [Plasmodium sp. gorilla clade G3]|nr:conserved Plasmodium protein, unknown function [Plasmodium sp. gorilla clade G3]